MEIIQVMEKIIIVVVELVQSMEVFLLNMLIIADQVNGMALLLIF